jgi:hypothetical protein
MTPMQSILIGGFLDYAGAITMLALLLWCTSLWKVYGSPLNSFRKDWQAWSVALLAASIVFLSTKIDFKVLSDETNLLSVANMLTTMGRASNTEQWVNYYHNYHALDVAVPSRPILFPVFTSLVQHVVGLVWWAPFVVNYVFLVLLFGLVLIWARGFLPARLHPLTTGALSLLMSPVLAIVSTSAGFDLCSITLGFACFLILQTYAERRDSDTLECLVYGLICFASVRYESIVAIPLTAMGLVLTDGFKALKKVSLQTYGIALLLVLPLFVQRYVTWGSFENPEGVAPFSLGHAWEHLPIFLRAFFTDGKGPYPILLHWLGAGGIALSLKRMKGLNSIPTAYGLFLLLLLLAHHFGRADHPTQARLFLGLSFILMLFALEFLHRCAEGVDERALLVVFGVLCFHHHEYAVHDPLSAQLTMTREVRFLREFLARDGRSDDLYVYDRPGQLSALGKSAISWKTFNEKTNDFLGNLRNSLYNRIILVERVPYDPKKAEPFSLVRQGYHLLPMQENQLSPDERLRVARIEF